MTRVRPLTGDHQDSRQRRLRGRLSSARKVSGEWVAGPSRTGWCEPLRPLAACATRDELCPLFCAAACCVATWRAEATPCLLGRTLHPSPTPHP